MSQARWHYWLDDSGTAHIREEDLPPAYTVKADLAEPLKISIMPRRNPDYTEFMVEIFRVTGKKEVILHKKNGAGEPGVNGK